HHAGYEYLATERLAGDARRIVDGRTEEIVGFLQRVAGVNADSDADRRRTVGECTSDLSLDRLRARHSPSSTRKGEHRPVALGLDDGSAMIRGGLFDHGVVSEDEVAPRMVTEAGEQDGGVDYVGEDDRHRAVGCKGG